MPKFTELPGASPPGPPPGLCPGPAGGLTALPRSPAVFLVPMATPLPKCFRRACRMKAVFTVHAIYNITNFSCKKNHLPSHMNSCEFMRIPYLNSCTKVVKNLSMNSCTDEFLNLTFLRKRYGEKVSVSLVLPEIFPYRVLSAWTDIEILYVDTIKGNILFKII